MKKGFTLIELLVVVLIIGILSAVALPQYTKAVEKSRAAEALTLLSSLQKAVDVYVMETGLPNGELYLPPAEPSMNLSIDLPSNLEYVGDGAYKSKYFIYAPFCNDGECNVHAVREDERTVYYELSFYRHSNGEWRRSCDPHDDLGVSICKSLGLKGFYEVN